MAILELTDKIYSALDNNDYIIGIFFRPFKITLLTIFCFQKSIDMAFMVMFIRDENSSNACSMTNNFIS